MLRLLSLILIYAINHTQPQQPQGGFRLKGKISNFRDSVLRITPWADLLKMELTDSVFVDNKGLFDYHTDLIKRPVTLWLSGKGISIPLFAAPGYDLEITADASAPSGETIRYKGIGAKVNQFWEFERVYVNRKNSKNWLDMPADSFMHRYVSYERYDSLINVMRRTIFSAQQQEEYQQYFQEAAETAIALKGLHNLFSYAFKHDYSTTATEEAIKKYLPQITPENIVNDNRLSSELYIQLLSNAYLQHLISKYQSKKQANTFDYIQQFYTGRTRDFILGRRLEYYIGGTAKPDELRGYKTYIENISTPSLRQQLAAYYESKLRLLEQFGTGFPAPHFRLSDSSGRPYNLNDFHGKVVFIELWASWCGPCIEEIPAIKKLYQKYKDRDNIVFVSVGINDKKGAKARYKIIEEQQMDWLQLEDRSGEMSAAYKVSYIPRTIVIGKNGEIIDFDAPMPSNKRLEEILDKALIDNSM